MEERKNMNATPSLFIVVWARGQCTKHFARGRKSDASKGNRQFCFSFVGFFLVKIMIMIVGCCFAFFWFLLFWTLWIYFCDIQPTKKRTTRKKIINAERPARETKKKILSKKKKSKKVVSIQFQDLVLSNRIFIIFGYFSCGKRQRGVRRNVSFLFIDVAFAVEKDIWRHSNSLFKRRCPLSSVQINLYKSHAIITIYRLTCGDCGCYLESSPSHKLKIIEHFLLFSKS